MANKEMVIKQYRQINREADDIKGLSWKIGNIEHSLSANWRGSETQAVFRMLNDICYDLRKINNDMIEFAHDYLRISEMLDNKEI